MIGMLLCLLVGLLHVGFLVLEMFLWDTPRGRKIFRNDPDFATKSKVLAANQGLYNGFLAAGLFWAALDQEALFAFQLRAFFLGCVVVAGLYGAATVSRRILWLQCFPALLAFAAVCLGI